MLVPVFLCGLWGFDGGVGWGGMGICGVVRERGCEGGL